VVDLGRLRADLAVEQESLDSLVRGLDDAGWALATPAEGWSVRDQVAHLAFDDEAARLAVADPAGFELLRAEAAADHEAFMQRGPAEGRGLPGGRVLAWWRTARAAMLDAFAGLEPGDRVPWFGPAMSAASLVTARLMETWAHGQDVADALGVRREPSDRLRSVAHLGVATRPYSYRVNGLPVPAEPVRVELRGPGGDLWAWGEEAAADRVTGPALDFCLVVTRRRHPDDTGLVAEGPRAREWLLIAQAYAGPPGSGRRPGQFPRPPA
jgi:uncharacterized protein (TIGR03084 family)